MTDVRKHTSMETDPDDVLHSPSKRQKLDMALSNVELEHALPEAPNTNSTMRADCAHEHSIVSSEGPATEAAYGITEFVSTELLGFSGILKKRYALSDYCR